MKKPRSQKARKIISQELTKLLKEEDKKGKIKSAIETNEV